MCPSNEPHSETIDDPRSDRPEDIAPVLPHLFLLMECDRPMSGGTRHSLAAIDEVVLGRGAKREQVRETTGGVRRLIVRVPAMSMSSLHGRLQTTRAGWRYADA